MKNRYLVFVGIGFELVGIIIATLYVGKMIDDNYGTKGLGLAIFPMLGLIGWIVHVVALAKSIEKAESKD